MGSTLLRSQGLEVDRQVGTSKYRIDMAIKDPDRPGHYLLGVECDGAKYHSSAVARDRDRLRQQVLESLGWNIHRVWSTDWIRDPRGALDRVIKRVNDLRSSLNLPARERSVKQTSKKADDPDDENAPGGSMLDSADDPYEKNPEIGVFSETPPRQRRKGDFYDNDDSSILEDVVHVVGREGPVHEEVLALSRNL